MIKIEIPSITINQFDAERFKRIEENLVEMGTKVDEMRALLQEVLTNRQAEVDALSAELKTDVDAQQAATAADAQPPTP